MVEKRNRPPKSCEPCRIRKLKCNRSLPCSTCAKKGKEAQCHYAPNADRNERPRNRNTGVGERLKNLESLLISLAQSGTPPQLGPNLVAAAERYSPAATNTPTYPGAEPGAAAYTSSNAPEDVLRDGALIAGQASSYVDSSHWSSFLDDIRSIREQLSPVMAAENDAGLDSSGPGTEAEWSLDDTPEEVSSEFTDLVLGSTEPLSREEVLSALPSRQVCDSLVSHYFRSHFTILPILHPAKFLQEYEAFWHAQSATSIIWVGLLFAVLSMAAGIKEFTIFGQGPGRAVPSSKSLCRRTEQCLLLGQYTRAGDYSLEAMLVHIQTCYLHASDADVNLWFTFGAIIRLAIRQGYHRDPSRLPGASISPFDAEMRRRIWTSIYQVDALMSFMIGLPSMIPSDDCDAELPRNLDYADLRPDMAVLPPSRPASEPTPILYTIAKAAVMAAFKKVVGHTRSLRLPPYDDTMALDRQVRDAYGRLPPSLQRKPLGLSIVDSPGIITHRITIEMLHLKTLVVLHRQYLTHRDPRFALSRRACLAAAASMLERQLELDEATQPRGQLYEDRWIVSSLTQNDFILAAMVICLDLTVTMRLADRVWKTTGVPAHADLGCGFAPNCAAIEASRRVWVAASAHSAEARVVVRALDSTLHRVQLYRNRAPLAKAFTPPARADHRPSVAEPESSMDGMEFIDWSLLDNPFPELSRDEMDLDAWIQDAVQPASNPAL